MRNEQALLLDMLLAAEKIEKFVAELSFAHFDASELHQSAVIREIQVIGEAARLISEPTKQANPLIAWAAIAGMRNRVVHEYFRMDTEILWNVTQNDIPILRSQLQALIIPKSE